MKTHQSIILVLLSCLLLLASACGKKSVHGVSGMEDFSANNEEVGYGDEQGFSGDPLTQFEEAPWGDLGDVETVEALSVADLHDEEGRTGLAGREQENASSMFSASTGSGVSGSSGIASGMGNSKGMFPSRNRTRRDRSTGSADPSAAHKNAGRMGARFSQDLRDVLFRYNSWQLSEQSHRILEANAKWLKAHPHARVTIEGHCDERGTQAYNYVLGKRRAETARQYLSHLGVPVKQMMVVSFGKDRPTCRVFKTSCFQANRRVHLSMDVNMASLD